MENYMERAAMEAMTALIKCRHPFHSGEDGAEVLAGDAWRIAYEMDNQRKVWMNNEAREGY